MRFSAWPHLSGKFEHLVDTCQHVERTGWDGIWVADHFMPNAEDNLGPTAESWTTLAALAVLVPRVRLGTLVTGNTYRQPAVLAKQAAQVDVMSGGRLVLGIGAGWQQNEHEAYGIPYRTVGGRLRRLEESVQVIRSLFANERTTFEGRYYTLRDAPLAPKPVQRPGPPILIGGGGEQVTLRIAAQHADEWNVWGTPEVLKRKGEILDRYCEEIGRDPKSIKHSAQAMLLFTDDAAEAERLRASGRGVAGTVDQVVDTMGRYRDAGVDEFIVPNFNMGARVKEIYDRFIEEVAPAFR